MEIYINMCLCMENSLKIFSIKTGEKPTGERKLTQTKGGKTEEKIFGKRKSQTKNKSKTSIVEELFFN